jgi:hypothetical protein
MNSNPSAYQLIASCEYNSINKLDGGLKRIGTAIAIRSPTATERPFCSSWKWVPRKGVQVVDGRRKRLRIPIGYIGKL